MRNLVFACAVVGMCAVPGYAGENNTGAVAAQFLKLGAGARAAGMSEAFVAVRGDASALYWNPAGLADLQRPHAALMHAAWFDDMTYEWAAGAFPVRGVGVCGLAMQYLSYGSLTRYDDTGVAGDAFNPQDWAASVSCARMFGAASVGVTAKYISCTIVHTATAYAVDIGGQYRFTDALTVGAVAQNLGTPLKFVRTGDALPVNVVFGAAYYLQKNWLAAVDLSLPDQDDRSVHCGTEYRWPFATAATVTGRAGYTAVGRPDAGTNGCSAGLGVSWRGYALDYAITPTADLGTTWRTSLSVIF